ncbi:MAG: hypothetical protein COA69_13310 [Robiginitomaculum sp.]|nr:MAG: hypothetical protein COA69_13310 [Robiginitomaculum sp.]
MAGIDKISRLVNWDDLSVFLAISKTGSISKAAALLGRTQPTISKRIENLEYRLGAPLFKRTPAGMTPTDIGQSILTHAIAMNRAVTSIERMATGFDHAATGDVIVQALDGLTTDWIIPGLADFQENHKGINLSFWDQNTVITDPAKEPDLTVQFTTEKPMDFIARQLGTLHYVPMVSRSYQKRHGIPRTMEDIVNYNLMYLRKSGLVVEKWERKSRALRELVTPSLSANTCSVILNAVLSGAGVSMLPSYMAKLYPQLLMLDYGIVYSYNFWLVQSPQAARLERVKTVTDWLTDIFNPEKNLWFQQDYVRPSEFSEIEIIMPH